KRDLSVPEQGMNVEALQTKYPIYDWKIYTEGTRKYWKIIRVGNHTENFKSTEPTDDKSASCVYREGDKHLHADREEVSIIKGTLTLMLIAKLLVEQGNKMSRELLRKIFMQAEIPRR
ncbi:hypothetical protein Tco_0962950, partial [Tanacetum coccineum]